MAHNYRTGQRIRKGYTVVSVVCGHVIAENLKARLDHTFVVWRITKDGGLAEPMYYRCFGFAVESVNGAAAEWGGGR